MKKNSVIFSKANFWFENIFYIFEQFMRELFLVPYIYFRNAFYIMKLSNSIISGSWLLIQWILYGPFFLCYNVFVDLHHYIQVL